MNVRSPSDSPVGVSKGAARKAVIRFLFASLFIFAALFISAGSWNWWEAWAYSGMTMFVILSSRLWMMAKNPEMAMERFQAAQRENVQSWDKILVPIIAVYSPLISLILAGLDERFGWSPDLPDWIQLLALGAVFLGSMIGNWAMVANRFFSSHVRIQTDRDHHVVSHGPYRFIRHPSYAGGLISWLTIPIFFSSYWVGIPSLIVMGLTILRTFLEDQTLLRDLPGYREYAADVRYRLLPGIW